MASLYIQLLGVLHRLGIYGSGGSIRKESNLFGTVCRFTESIFIEILKSKSDFIHWPNAEERAEISLRFAREHGLEGTVGVLDGTSVIIYQRGPAIGVV